MTTDRLCQQIGQFLGFSIPEAPVALVSHDVVEEHGYRRVRVTYASPEGEPIPAFLLLPMAMGHLLLYLSIISTTARDTSEKVKSAAWWATPYKHSDQLWPGTDWSS